MSPKMWTVAVTHPDETPKGETTVRRNALSPHALTETPHPAVRTIYDLVQWNALRWEDVPCFGTRKVVKVHVERQALTMDGAETVSEKIRMSWELGPYEYRTYKQVAQEGLEVGSGLRKLGLVKGDKIAIYADASAHWQLMAQASASQSMPIVTAYATLGEDGLMYSLMETNAKAIFVDPQLIPTLLQPLKSSPSVKFVIYHGDPLESDLIRLKSVHGHLTVLHYDVVRESGKSNPVEPVPPKPADLACIMYTSGSFGRPKGALLTHRNIIAALSGVHLALGKWCHGKRIRTLGYLPLAHIYGFVFELVAQYWGATIGYARYRTLTDSSVRNCKGDLREFKPQLLPSVPALWETIRKAVETKVAQSSRFSRAIFWGSLWIKDKMLSYGIPGSSFFDLFMHSWVKEITGGEVFWSLCGGSSIAEDTQRFVCAAICPMASAYGMTETCAMGSFSTPSAWVYGASGPLESCIEAKLVDVPELGYFVDNCPPQGQILLRGPCITSGYLNREQENKQLFDKDEWLKTGDIGELNEQGMLKVIDRVKNLAKTLNGEYVAIEKLESTYITCNLLLSICIYADPNQIRPIAIAVPVESELRKFATAKGLAASDTSLKSLIKDQRVTISVFKELLYVARRARLARIEWIQGLVLVEEEWSPENSLLTAARKLNRRNILGKYKHLVEERSILTTANQ